MTQKFDWIRRMPFFYAAIVLGGFIFAVRMLQLPIPHFSARAPANDVSRRISKDASEIFLGGRVVSDIKETRGSYGDREVSFILKAEKIWTGQTPSDAGGLVKVYLTNPHRSFDWGDTLVLKGSLMPPSPPRNPGGFDQRAYFEPLGIRALFYGGKNFDPKILSRRPRGFFGSTAHRLKKYLSGALHDSLPARDAAFLEALFLGERSGLDEDFKELFLKTGTLHILSVSGFNVGFLSLTIFLMLKPFKIHRRRILGFTAAAIWAYCFLVGWQAPVVRASIMASVFILAECLGRRQNTLNTLGFAAVVILLLAPLELWDVGFQLSFLAVFAIVRFVPVFIERPRLLPNEVRTFGEKAVFYFRELLAVSFVCLVTSLPITVQKYCVVTPLSLLANLVVVPLSFALFFLEALFFLTHWMKSFFFFIPLAIRILMQIFTTALFAIENLPGAYFVTGVLPWPLWTALTIGVFYLISTKRIQKAAARAVLIGLFLFDVFIFQDMLHYFRPFSMTVIDVGQGDAIYFEFPGGRNFLMDAGKGGQADKGRWAVMPYLRFRGARRIDAVAFSHPQEDHIGGMMTLFREFKIKHVIETGVDYDTVLYHALEKEIERQKIPRFLAGDGARLEGLGEVRIEVLHPVTGRPHKNINDDSLVLKIIYRDTSFLLTGDIQRDAMKDLLENENGRLSSTVLKVPHHGARVDALGGDFLRAVNPRWSVISVGRRNPFGHPSPVTLQALSEIPGNTILRTDKNRAVRLVSDGSHIKLDGSGSLAYDSF